MSNEATTIDAAQRTADGTILPPAEAPNTGDHDLIAALPQLETSSQDLRLGDTIGEGGMGLVRVAEQLAIGRLVAVKMLRPERVEPSLTLHLLREAWITGLLEHPNIVPIYSVGVDAAGSPLIVMKRIEGTSWSKFIRDDAHDLRWHLKILVQVANAIDFAGSRGIIHRDLKPDNVMIGKFGEVYVLDWGIAVSLEDDHGGRLPLAKDVRVISGTPGYMAPEMVEPNGVGLRPWTDVYLLGAVLHELITKQKRHRGGDIGAALLSALESAPYTYEAHLPPELANIANRAMHRDPEQRFPTAGDMRTAIEKFLEHESSRELAEQASQRLATWKKLEDTDGAPDPIAIQNLFGEARFAFQQALREWPENDVAKAGLLSCLERKFAYDLARDDFESASVILGELGERRPDLEDRLAELRARMEKRKGELVALRKLQASRDLDVGRRTRSFMAMVQSIGFGAIPPLALVLRGMGMEIGYGYFYVASFLKLSIGGLLWLWARDSLSKTEVNRQLTASLFLLIGAEIIFRPFGQRLGHPIETSLTVDFGIYFLVLSTLAITLERRLVWCLPVYFFGAMLSYISPPNIYWFLGATHFACFLALAFLWRPEFLTGADNAAARKS